MSEIASRPDLPDPAPGFPGLVDVHLRLLVREARLGTALVVVIVVALPLVALLTQPPAPGEEIFLRVQILFMGAMGLTGFLVFLWPESVWRGLGPGRRLALDALPASRRSNRMARVVAGAVLPMVVMGSVIVTHFILMTRGLLDIPPTGLSEIPGFQGPAIVATLLWGLTAYAFSSIFALRWGKVILGLMVTFGILYLVPLLMVLLGMEELVSAVARWAMESPASPLRFLMSWFQLQASDVVPGLAWLAVFGGAAFWLAGRHDRP